MNKDEYVMAYINLCARLCTKPDDYTKGRVKKHNIAMRELSALEKELRKDMNCAEKVYSELMDNENVYIQLTAAATCLQLNINTKRAEKILKHIKRTGDRWHSMDAERVLKVWHGEIGPNDPF